jgi:hypothetical protein
MEAEEQAKQYEAQVSRGISAQYFLDTLKEGDQYFMKLFEEIDKELNQAIAGLDPSNTTAFTIFQARRQALYEPINRVHADIDIGKRAGELLSGKIEEGGIL